MVGEYPYLFLASMDVSPGWERTFHDIYNVEHIPNLLQVPGVMDVTRVRPVAFRINIAGAVQDIGIPANEPAFTAVYRIQDPAVLASNEFGNAVEAGRWPNEIRPHTVNRRHMLFQAFDGSE